MPKEIRNLGASVRARLLGLSKSSNQTFDVVLTRFVLERLLYRLSLSPHADRFVLKGAMLLMTWLKIPHRTTRDLDLLGFGEPNEEAMLAIFRRIIAEDTNDGVRFEVDALQVDRIREGLEYGGLRLRTTALVGGARVPVTVDVGFGDATEPGLEMIEYPVLLDLPAPRLRAYARETVIAEKFHAMVALGRANSRMKDFYDLWVLSRSFPFDDDRLARAIAATFGRRRTAIPTEPPDALTPAFGTDEQKQRQWSAFAKGVAVEPGQLGEVVAALRAFIMPHAAIATRLARPTKQ